MWVLIRKSEFSLAYGFWLRLTVVDDGSFLFKMNEAVASTSMTRLHTFGIGV